MLKQNSWWTEVHQDAYQRSIRMLLTQPLSTLMTITMIAVTLMLAILSWIGTYQISVLGKDWQQTEVISLYLHPALSEAEQQVCLQKVQALADIESATLTTATEGLEWLKQQEGMQEIVQYLPSNPLPAVIRVVPGAQLKTPAAVQDLFQTLKSFNEVAQAKFDSDWIERLYTGLKFLNHALQLLMVLCVASVIMVIGNTLRLLIHNRYDDIRVLQLVGAPHKYIMRPFLYASIWYGFLAALLAIIFVDALLCLLRMGLNQWADMYAMQWHIPLLPVVWILSIVLMAIGLSWTGARLTLKYYI